MKQLEFEKHIKKNIEALADERERECGDWQEGEGLSAENKRKLFERVAAAAGKPETARSFRLRKSYLVVLAAALTLAIGTGAAGSRVWRSANHDLERESEVSTKVDNDEKEDILLEEEVIYREIADKLGIVPMWLTYKPEGMVLSEYVIKENVGWANLYYLYEDSVITITMQKQSDEAAGNVQWDGNYRKLDVDNKKYEVEAYCVDEKEHNYGANILYANGYYSIFGHFENENEFLEILKEIFFKNY